MEEVEREIQMLLAGEVVPLKGKVDLKLKSATGPIQPLTKRTVTYIVMAMVFDDRGRMILIQEAKESCYGKWYPPAGRVEQGENLVTHEGPIQPITKRTVTGTYIVMAMVFDDRGRLILIQEAKESCYGKWYPPAGRVEQGENLVDAVKREVLEEAGVEFEPQSVISVRIQHFSWVRITYVGTCTGNLKTTEQKDSESLQASWFTVDQIKSRQVKLRHEDFFAPMDLALKYLNTGTDKRHPAYSIGIQAHHTMIHRLLIMKETQSGSLEVLCNRKKGSLVTCSANPPDGLLATTAALFMEVFNLRFKDGLPKLELLGLLTLEHYGIPAKEHDGMCLTTVYLVPPDQQQKMDKITNKDFSWIQITKSEIVEQLRLRTLSKDGPFLIPILQ